MPAPSIFHSLERGVSAAHVSRYNAAYDVLLLGQVYTATLPVTEDGSVTTDEARNYLAERGVRAGFGLAPNDDGSTLLTIFGG